MNALSNSQSKKLVIVSGPSGVGKGTVLRHVLADCELPIEYSVSVTTRPARPDERDGVDYYFVSQDDFDAKREAGEFLESCEVFGRGYWYGTLKSHVDASLDAGKWVILEIDVEGADQVVKVYPNATTIFVGLEDVSEIERRLRSRGTEDEETIQKRLQVALGELTKAAAYMHFIVNDDVERAANEICSILKQSSEPRGATNA